MAHPPMAHAATEQREDGNGNGGEGSSTVDAQGGSVSQDASGDSAAAAGDADDVRALRNPLVHTVRSEYPLNVAVDFTQLRANALRRYMAFHRIQEVPGSSREQLAVAVARHFNGECKRADEGASISSFVSYLKNSKDEQDVDYASDKENSDPRNANVVMSSDGDSDFDMDDDDRRDGAYDYYPNQREEDEGRGNDDEDGDRLEDDEYDEPAYAPRKRKPSSSEGSSDTKSSSAKSPSSNANNSSISANKKKKRKARLYCVCKGASHGDMIACDNKKCLDRSNWYHMGCIGLDDAPETWFCPMCQEQDPSEIPENQYRKPVASVTYGDMISHALSVLPQGKGTFKEICDFVEKQYESQLNWKLESDQRKSPVWKSSVRKILFSNMRFRKHPDDKGLFCLAPA